MPRNGLWINEREFVRFDEGKSSSGSLSQELAIRSRTLDYFAIGNLYLPNPDPVLKSQGRDIRVYEDLMIDDRVAGGYINRAAASKGLVWEIEKGQSAARYHKATKDYFGKLKVHRIIEAIIRGARGFGHGPLEVIWDQRDAITVPVDIVAKPQRWFVFNQVNELRFLSRDHLLDGEELPPRKFLCPSNEATYDNPYGLGLLSRCFWPVTFKKGGWRFWVQFAEKFGQVWPVGKLPRSATTEQIEALLDSLDRMLQDGVGVIPDDGSVDLKESATKGATADLFGGIIDKANSAISTVWLGHSGAAESTPGKLGGENAAVDVRDDLRDDDANLIMETLQQVIDWTFEVNGWSGDTPRFVLKEKEKIDTTQAERDDKLSKAMDLSGLKLSSVYYQKTYSLAPEDVEEKQAPVEPVPADVTLGVDALEKKLVRKFAELADAAAPDNADLLAERLGDEARPLLEGWLAAAKRIVDSAGNLVDLRQDFIDQSAALDIAPLAGTIRDALLLGHLLGRAEVLDEIAASEAGASFAEIAAMHTTPARGWVSFAEPEIVSALRLPFSEAIRFFRNKVTIPTERWNDLWTEMHSQGFMIAGAMKGDLLGDLRDAVDQTITQGLTLADFRKTWDSIVERHGWSYVGGRNWRTRIVYETNTRQAYNAGRWQQITDPDVLRTRPYLLYKHGDSIHPRVLHLSWDGTVLPADDPWWSTHSPQNGWGCKCKVFSAGERDIQRLGTKAKRTAPNDGSYTWIDKQGRSFDIPNGIDPGFQYNPGTAAKRSRDILNDRIDQLPPDIARQIRAEIALKDAA